MSKEYRYLRKSTNQLTCIDVFEVEILNLKYSLYNQNILYYLTKMNHTRILDMPMEALEFVNYLIFL